MRFNAVKTSLFTLLLAVCGLAALAGPAAALTEAPGWMVNSHSFPTNLVPGGSGLVAVDVYNVGAKPSEPGAIVTDTLPEGVSATSQGEWSCAGTKPVTCSYVLPSIPVGREAEFGFEEELALKVSVNADALEGRFPNQVSVAGGGALTPASAASLLTISSDTARFGFADADAWLTNADGTVDTQAGSHPYEVTLNFDLNTEASTEPANFEEARNIEVKAPPGLIGNPTAAPRCLRQQFDENSCPASTQVGVVLAGLSGFEALITFPNPVYNLVAPPGTPAEFGFTVEGVHAFLDAAVRSGGDYGITEHVDNVPQRRVVRSVVTLWGMPADPSHDALREGGSGCKITTGGCASSGPDVPFLTLPSSCVASQGFSITANTWANERTVAEREVKLHDSNGVPVGFTGCDHLGFAPSISANLETATAGAPTGLGFNLHVPQEESVEGLAQADLKNATVALPAGLVLNPAQANGLVGCPEAGPEGINLKNGEPAHCPNASKVGSVKVKTPLLAHELEGSVFVAQQGNLPGNGTNPFGSLLAIYVTAEGSGVTIKLAGKVEINPITGQLTTTFSNTPQLPFEDFKLTFFGEPRAALVTPSGCGSYTTTSQLTPWSNGTPAEPSSGFMIAAGCAPGFNPSFTAGMTNNQAGASSPFTLTFSRQDGEQRLGSVQVTMPPGLLGRIAGIPQCPEPQAGRGECGEASLLGEASTAVGAGPDPYWVKGGKVYLTGPYNNGPFGLSIVVPTTAGPFTLTGNGGPGREIVRASIRVNPNTAQITVLSDSLPTILEGIPLDIRTVNVTVNRSGFMFNPTNCSALSVTGMLESTATTKVAVSSPFEAANCANLPFKPAFSASTQGKASKANGASLVVKVASGAGQANIAKVDLQLPIALPSRLTTLQKACVEAVFNVNPAACDEGSVIGYATIHTPVLTSPLSGPAYLVSHGGAAFPDVEFVLQGEGVTLVLDGKTDIKNGITYSRFQSLPDAPFTTFETVLPTGPHSVLAAYVPANANYSLCGQKLVMPTTITGQNGAQVTQSTNIAVTGCGKPSIKITKAKIKGNTVLVTVTTTQQGTVTVSGNGLKTIKKTLGAGAHQLKVSLTKNGRTARKHHRKTKVKASVKDSNGSSSKTMTLKL
jgi:hypothetical protein